LISARTKSRHSLCESLVCSVSLGPMALTFRAFESGRKRRFGYFSQTTPAGRLNRD
jgi:hypothetical protein